MPGSITAILCLRPYPVQVIDFFKSINYKVVPPGDVCWFTKRISTIDVSPINPAVNLAKRTCFACVRSINNHGNHCSELHHVKNPHVGPLQLCLLVCKPHENSSFIRIVNHSSWIYVHQLSTIRNIRYINYQLSS